MPIATSRTTHGEFTVGVAQLQRMEFVQGRGSPLRAWASLSPRRISGVPERWRSHQPSVTEREGHRIGDGVRPRRGEGG
jgi:hypothetical protein